MSTTLAALLARYDARQEKAIAAVLPLVAKVADAEAKLAEAVAVRAEQLAKVSGRDADAEAKELVKAVRAAVKKNAADAA